MNRFFSDRHGYRGPEPEIAIREDAPDFLRFQAASIARNCELSPTAIRAIVCDILLEVPDPNNWSEYPNIWEEVLSLLTTCEWYKVYDIAEALWRSFEYRPDQQERFENDLNRVFREKGIGWELKNPDGIVFRGDQTFAVATEQAVDAFVKTGRYTAAGEIREALKDISRRPEPDRTGAIQHSMAALECVARDLTNSPNLNLGQIINGLSLTPPMGDAVHKLWGYASQKGRHVQEGHDASAAEAELVVSVACSLAVFLLRRD
ncbi:AbiJ-NTD4 domain-containing protein [Rhizobium leguminosarum]|uniref:AbiJ-NTD4 domain-containing protein n=1 Tax=Rhizobium leguminosarum TaxID=384 RepID=UPI001C96F090|nr:hypothetical protein [Rhizobium leguminosarum]MBY5666217.1 hypothetical protein [Rhizobium leguminosarum]MBY5679515.1 hypothetical protein [Rhizobium leguminosarum]